MKILLAPLDWGLGHATRSLPIAYALESLGHEIQYASSGAALELLRQALPGRKGWEIPGYRVKYESSAWGFAGTLIRQAPRIAHAVRQEHAWLVRRAPEEGFKAIISDGRYGLWHKHLPSFLITHQIRLMPPGGLPFRESLAHLGETLNRLWLKRFREVWIPDIAEAPGLSGILGHTRNMPRHARYIGPLNRFAWDEAGEAGKDETPILDILAMVSGPEPQRGLFENQLREQMAALSGTRLLIQGLPGSFQSEKPLAPLKPDGLTVWPHAPGPLLRPLLMRAKAVVARSGYTTIMELACLGIKPILMVPTPGQPEQEQLARDLAAAKWVIIQKQAHIDLAGALPKLGLLPGLAGPMNPDRAPGATRDGLALWFKNHPLFGIP